eukprot:1143886-Pelagomonas_calceolata.AAC.3
MDSKMISVPYSFVLAILGVLSEGLALICFLASPLLLHHHPCLAGLFLAHVPAVLLWMLATNQPGNRSLGYTFHASQRVTVCDSH